MVVLCVSALTDLSNPSRERYNHSLCDSLRLFACYCCRSLVQIEEKVLSYTVAPIALHTCTLALLAWQTGPMCNPYFIALLTDVLVATQVSGALTLQGQQQHW